jgi:CheY-like chemotaxis protein
MRGREGQTMARVLVIDDSLYMRAKIQKALQEDGYGLIEADSGIKGLQMVLSHAPDCILLDLIMPDMDGLKVLKALRDQGSRIPVIVLTADIQESVRRECLDLGARAFITKPPKDEDLRRTVKEVLDPGQKRTRE